MARRNQNAFLKRQKELKRVRKAQEKMARRHGKKVENLSVFEGPSPESQPPQDSGAAGSVDPGKES